LGTGGLLSFLLAGSLASFSGGVRAQPAASRLLWDSPDGGSAEAALRDYGGVKVLWWQAHAGRILLNTRDFTFSRNLAELALSPDIAPDIVALGEYTVDTLRPRDLAALKKIYPHSVQRSYDDATNAGMMVFSRYPLSVLSADFLKGEDGRGARPALILDVNVSGKRLIFIPIHIFDAWRQYQADHGKLKTGLEIGFGLDNPVHRQIQEFLAHVKSRVDGKLLADDTVIVGDFNQPAALFGVETSAYGRLRKELNVAVDDAAPTFPTRGTAEAGSYPDMAIDHAFASPGLSVKKGLVLRLKGSNHYPLYFSVYPAELRSALPPVLFAGR